MSDAIIVRGANKHYGDFAALDNVDFEVPSGSLTALLGPSGSGKSTLLRAIAGLDLPDTGTITINGRDVTHVPPQRRGIGFVFQHYAAFKHLTVRETSPSGSRSARGQRPRSEKVDNLLEVVGLAGFQTRYPNQLSGGQRQRMALARALAVDPRCCCSTSRSVRWTPRFARTCGRGCAACTTRCTSRQCWSPTTRRRRSTSRIASRCSTRAVSSRSVPSPRSTTGPANAFVMSFLGTVLPRSTESWCGQRDIRVGRSPDLAVARR